MRTRRPIAAIAAFVVVTGTLAAVHATPAAADTVAQPLPLSQRWTSPTLITTNNDWSGVPGIVGYRGDDLTTATGTDPATITADGAGTPVNVIADQANPNTLATGGIAEFALTDPVVALQGSGTADAPHLVVTFDATGESAVRVRYRLRDIDGSNDDAVQQVALHYRVGGTGAWTNIPEGYVPDASALGATRTTDVDVTLPPAADGAPLVQIRVMTTNAPANDEWIGVDDIRIGDVPDVAEPPTATCPPGVLLDEGAGAAVPLTATDPDSTIASAAITSAPVAGITLDAADPAAPTLLVDPSAAPGPSRVTVTFTNDDDAPQSVSCEIRVSVLGADPVAIHDVQGAGPVAAREGWDLVVEGVVTTVITRNDAPNGAFVQTPADAPTDGDPATSEGLYVFCATTCPTDLAAGDLVRATGRVDEFFGNTQVTAMADGVEVLDRGLPLPAATDVAFSSTPTTDPAAFESVEGMVTRFPAALTVTEFFQLARFGQIELVGGDRPYTYTHVAAPSATGNAAYLAEVAARTIVLEDTSDDENDMVLGPDRDEPYPFPTPGLRVDHRFRAGDTIEGMTGVMQYAFGAWRQRAIEGVEDIGYEFTSVNRPPAEAPDVAGRITVAGFNVLNYFATIDTPGSTGPCGPSGTLDCRGADSVAERDAQLAKMVVALRELDADVYGLTEIENDTGAATQQIVDALNAAAGPGTYASIDTGFVGGDAIKVAIIYNATTVAPQGDWATIDPARYPGFITTLNRPPVIQTFTERATDERFTVAVNHLKSKGSACTGDPDLGDGAGNCNRTRTAAAAAEAAFLATDPTASGDPDVMIIGDLNSYRNEEPITTLAAAGYTDLVRRHVGNAAYSYLFDGAIGYLDHALATASLSAQVTGVGEWHVNADEIPLFDYNDDVPDAGESAFEEESDALPLAGDPDPFRTSDHDPVVVGLDPASLAVDHALIVQARRGGGTLLLDATVLGGPWTACPSSLEVRAGDAPAVRIGRLVPIGRTSTCAALTSTGLVTFDWRTGDIAGLVALPGTFVVPGDAVTLRVLVDGRSHAVVEGGRRAGLIWTAT